ncbi:MAG: hypothetical protein RJA70_4113 [Pseudomonadota bacterium]
MWRYKTRRGDETSRAIVLQVDEATPVGKVVHFCLTQLAGLALDGSGAAGDIGFLPLQAPIASECVLELESMTTELPHLEDFADAYAEWLQAVHAGEAGAWDIPLVDVVMAVATGRASN